MAGQQWCPPRADRGDPAAGGAALCVQVPLGSAPGSLAHRPARSPQGLDGGAADRLGGCPAAARGGRHQRTHARTAGADHPAGPGLSHRQCHPGHRDRCLSNRPAAGGGARPGGCHPQLRLSHRHVAGEFRRLPASWPLRLAGRLRRLCRADPDGCALHPGRSKPSAGAASRHQPAPGGGGPRPGIPAPHGWEPGPMGFVAGAALPLARWPAGRPLDCLSEAGGL